MSNYVQEKIDALREFHPNMPDELVDLYVLLAFVKGEDVTLEDVHDAWSVWTNRIRPDHHSLIPFEALTQRVQELDQPYANSIATIA